MKHMFSYKKIFLYYNYLAEISKDLAKKGILTFHILFNAIAAQAVTVSYI